jgi:hypothetical protein
MYVSRKNVREKWNIHFMSQTLLLSLSVKKSREMGRACGTYWRKEKYVQGSWLGT